MDLGNTRSPGTSAGAAPPASLLFEDVCCQCLVTHLSKLNRNVPFWIAVLGPLISKSKGHGYFPCPGFYLWWRLRGAPFLTRVSIDFDRALT